MKDKNLLHNISKESIQIIGAELKRRRRTQSKTLVNLNTKCSVSYISKIENGKIIPKMHILNDLCQEHGITEDELDKLLKVDEMIDECIINLFWGNREKVIEIYNSIYTFDNYKVNLIKIMYEMLFFHWDKCGEYLSTITVIKENIEEKDLYIYYYLKMCYENSSYNYPSVYKLYKNLEFCKNNYLIALASKEMFIAVAKFGVECPIYVYKDYFKKYQSLFNYFNDDMYELLIDKLIQLKFPLEDSIVKELKPSKKLQYLLANNKLDELDELLLLYSPTQYEKLLIATAKGDYSTAEKIYKKLQLSRLSAKDVIVANYCNYINKGNDEDLATYIINVALEYSLKINDGILYKMFLKKLSEIAFNVGKYKAVAEMNLIYFDMLEKGKICLL